MDVPTPDEFCRQRGYEPFPPRWERWLSQVRNVVVNAQPIQGRNTTVDVHEGKGSVINVANRKPSAGCTCLVVRFDSVVIDCPCFVPAGGGLSQLYTDGGNFNGITFATQADTRFPSCAPCARQESGAVPQFHEKVYAPAEDCTGSPIVDSEENTNGVAIANISGTWYVAVKFFNVLFFYGHSSDLSSPITNQLTVCNATPTTFVNDFTACYGSPWSDPMVVLAHGGTATVSPCPL